MFDPTEVLEIPQAEKVMMLGVQIAVGGAFRTSTLILFANDIQPGPTTVFADLVPPTFTGYAAVAGIVFGTPYIDPAGDVIVTAPSVDFICSGGTPTDIIYGWALVDAGLTTLRQAARLGAPVPIAAPGDGTTIVPWLLQP